jgi:murein DD-endopeptidase MepM/ murein hydrolase activator NlpD
LPGDRGGGVWAMYAHLIKGSLLVTPGDKVKKGQKIAELGNTGKSSGPHLHFQLMDNPALLQADAAIAGTSVIRSAGALRRVGPGAVGHGSERTPALVASASA